MTAVAAVRGTVAVDVTSVLAFDSFAAALLSHRLSNVSRLDLAQRLLVYTAPQFYRNQYKRRRHNLS